MNLLCLFLGHKIRVRYFVNSRWKMNRCPAVCGVAMCDRCGKELSPPANPPKGTK